MPTPYGAAGVAMNDGGMMDLSLVIAYSDRLPLDAKCSDCGYLEGYGGCDFLGKHFRSLLEMSVASFLNADVAEAIVVNFNNEFDSSFEIEGARVIHVNDGGRFSEWDAKMIGIEASKHSAVVTSNSDIYCLPDLIPFCSDYLESNPDGLYQVTKGWLNQKQTDRLLKDGVLDCCRHEVVYDDFEGNRLPIDGVEPSVWDERSVAARIHRQRHGIDAWKNAGDFQAFRKSLLDKVEYPLGSRGWGGGDLEFRLRVHEAGLREYWERREFAWHMFHPVKPWTELSAQGLEQNLALWDRSFDWSEGGFQGMLPPTENQQEARKKMAPQCMAYKT